MDINNIFIKRTKPNLNNYNKDELIIMINKYHELYKTDYKSIINLDNINLNELIELALELWKNHPIQETDELIDCLFCLNPITNSDYMITSCNHLYHSTCFFNYLFNSFNSTNSSSDSNYLKKNKICNYFRCPKCRKYLTEQIYPNENNFNVNTEIHENIIINESDVSMDLISGLWIENNYNNSISIQDYSDSSDSI